ncbi:MAG: alpha/beta hydrolase [Planctomycetes bacterium]|nr:alpha/beta hydrolase [Planctomycetota bacterium]
MVQYRPRMALRFPHRRVGRFLFTVATVVLALTFVGACAGAQHASDAVSRLFLRPSRSLVTLRAPPATTLVPIQFAADDDTVLRGTLYDRADSDRVVLVIGGISGNHTWYGPYADAIVAAGFDALLFDTRGFGASDGAADATTLVADVGAAYRYLIEARSYARADTAVFGISLGSVLALAVARAEQPGAVVVEDLFLPHEMFDRLKKRLEGNVLGRLTSSWVESTMLPVVDPITNARAFDGPMLFVAGSIDPISKPAATIRVANARERPSRVWIAPHAGHAPEVLLGYDLEYAAHLATFLRAALLREKSPHVATTLLRAEGRLARLRVDCTAAVIAQIVVTDGAKFFFAIRELPAGATELALDVDFEPRHTFATVMHHATRGADGTLAATASPFARSMADYAAFASRFDAELKRLGKKLAAPIAAKRLCSAIEGAIPDPRSIHASVRPRFARRLAPLATVLLDASAPHAHEFGLRVGSFLPEHPDAWTGYGDAGFEGGFRDAVCADLCERLVPILTAAGHLDAASDCARRALAMKP